MMAFSNALSNKVFMASILLVFGMLMTSVEISGAQSIGVCYGTSGNNLPSEADVVALYKANGIERMRIYVPNLKTLEALKGSNIELTLTILNDQLQSLTDAGAAKDWFQKYVKAYLPDVKFKYIAVGNEIKPGDAATNYVLPVIQNIQNEVSSANLKDQIKVSTAIDTNLLAKSYPPSDGVFSDASNQFLKPVIEFLANNGAPLLVNVYPYFPYKYNKKDISLPYALFTSPNVVVTDDKSKLGYQNLFDALMDSLYSALEKYNAPNLKIVVSESGWPSAGGEGASVENASTYYKNLIGHVKGGTPKKKEAIETYLFAMFDENVKPGDEDEKHFGLFSPDKNNKYQISFT